MSTSPYGPEAARIRRRRRAVVKRITVTTSSTALVALLLLAAKPHHVATTTAAGSSGGTAAGTGTKKVTGDAVETRFGPVQVRITLTNGKITAVDIVQQPQDSFRDLQIGAVALPQLTKEALAAQSSQIDSVSGATYTSQGYIGSLQSAIDAAGK